MKYDYEKTPQGFCQTGSEYNINYAYLGTVLSGFLAKNGAKKIKVLEVGAGGGRNLLFLAKRFEGRVETFGTDISNSAMMFAQEQGVDHTIVSEAMSIPYKQEFDLILLIDLLEHLSSMKQVEQTLISCMDHLNPSGILYISSPIELNRYSLTWWFSRSPFLKSLTFKYFGHTIQFDNVDLLKLVKKHVINIKVFYSAHVFTQLQMLVFFYFPKVFMEMLLGNKLSYSLRDSSQYSSAVVGQRVSFLILLKKLIYWFSRPMAAVGFWESQVMRLNEYCAENIHIVIHK